MSHGLSDETREIIQAQQAQIERLTSEVHRLSAVVQCMALSRPSATPRSSVSLRVSLRDAHTLQYASPRLSAAISLSHVSIDDEVLFPHIDAPSSGTANGSTNPLPTARSSVVSQSRADNNSHASHRTNNMDQPPLFAHPNQQQQQQSWCGGSVSRRHGEAVTGLSIDDSEVCFMCHCSCVCVHPVCCSRYSPSRTSI